MKTPKRPTRPPQYGYYRQPQQPRWQQPKQKIKFPWYIWVIIGVVVISLLGAIGANYQKPTETTTATATAVQAAATVPAATSAPATATATPGPTAVPKPTQPPAPTALTEEPVASVVARLQAGQCVAADWFINRNLYKNISDRNINPLLQALDGQSLCVEGIVNQVDFADISNIKYLSVIYFEIPDNSLTAVVYDDTPLRHKIEPDPNQSKFKEFPVKKGNRVRVTGTFDTNLSLSIRITDPKQLVILQ